MEAQIVRGTGVVAGYAHAPAMWTRPAVTVAPTSDQVPENQRDNEAKRLTAATEVVADRYMQRAANATGTAAEVLVVSAGLTMDPRWTNAAIQLIQGGTAAEQAATQAIDIFVVQFEALGGVMAERATDLRDVRNRVVSELLGLPEPGIPEPTSPVILLAEDLAPADTTTLDPKFVRALVTREGGPTSHTAIIARQLGIPCVVAVHGLDKIEEGTALLVDGTTGIITIAPDAANADGLVAEDAALREEIRSWAGPARTADGEPVQLLANVQDGAGARKAADKQAEGVGLYRTELGFLSAQVEPTVDEQAAVYAEVLEAFEGRKVVIRTLDAGSDKPVPFANQDDEDNPALGVRGIRLNWINPKLLDRQLDAIAQAARETGAEPWVMAPMVATIDEALEFAEKCRERELKPGIMVEVPSTAVLADAFVKEVDFFSIGTNDLAQYTMAADRMSSHLAEFTDPWQPAVLRLIQMTAQAGQRAGKPVGVCGEAAADPLLACVMLGLGINSLSMAYGAIPAVGVQVSKVTMEQCREAAEQVVAARNARDAKELAKKLLG